VAVGWRPYSDGQWTFVGSFGWTWAAGPRWGWPTHHYGRWGWGGTNWYWIPGTQWAPAWVSWGSANGYLGWCPLGFDNRPAVPVTSVGAWNGWTTVPSTAFSQSVVVGRHGVRPVEAQWRRSATIRTAGPARPIGRSRPPAPLASRGTSIAVAAPTTRVPSTDRAAGSVSVRRAPQTSVSAEPAARFGSAARPATSRWIARAEATAAASEASPVSRASRSSSPSRGETAPPGVSRSETRARALPSPVRVSPGSTALATSPARRALLPTTAAARSRPATRTPSTRASTSASTRTHSVTAPAVPPTLTLAPASIFIRAAAPR
jgi:hypothetical protein